jgi:hypothetical protein
MAAAAAANVIVSPRFVKGLPIGALAGIGSALS